MKSYCRRKEKEENHGHKRGDTHSWFSGPNTSGEKCGKLLFFWENREKRRNMSYVCMNDYQSSSNLTNKNGNKIFMIGWEITKEPRGDGVEELLGSERDPLCCIWQLLKLFVVREAPLLGGLKTWFANFLRVMESGIHIFSLAKYK